MVVEEGEALLQDSRTFSCPSGTKTEPDDF